ncbi:MAG: glycosyltransferase family 4 protein [Candidatus Methylomirabilales bacterium]
MEYLELLRIPFLIALVASLFFTPLCRGAARRLGVLDTPGLRKIHTQPVPMMGGVAILAAFGTGLLLSAASHQGLWGILLGTLLLFILGLMDDVRGVGPWTKLGGQVAAASIAIAAGVQISFLGSPYLNIPLTLLWIVAITNAFNLLDNMDGLSAGLAAISAATFALLAARYQALGPEQPPTAAAGAALAGACLGFLRYNLYRATIFMGDSGSLALGFLLACLAAFGSWRSPTVPTSILIPLLVLAYPIFDITLVVLLRWRRGHPIFQGAKDHSSHRLVNLGLDRTEVVLLIYLFALCHASTAVLITSVTLRLSLLALAISASVLFIFGLILRKVLV